MQNNRCFLESARRLGGVAATLSLLVVGAGSAGCRPVLDGPVAVEAVTSDPQTGAPVLDVVELQDVTDLWRAEGERIRFLTDMNFEIIDASIAEGAHERREDLRDDIRQKALGAPPAMHLSEQNGVWVADDYSTLVVLSAYAAVEKSLTAFAAWGPETGATRAPLDVGLNSSASRFLVPEASIDNASYNPYIDAMYLGRAGIGAALDGSDGSPGLALDAVVISHELGHRMYSYLMSGTQSYAFFLEQSSRLVSDRGGLLRAGMNEGSADVLAIATHGLPRIPSLSERRALDGDFARELTYEALRNDDVNGCDAPSQDFENRSFDHYCVGTLFAGTLWLAAGEDMVVFQEVMAPALVRALPQVGATMAAQFEDEGEFTYDVDVTLRALTEAAQGTAVQDGLCDAVRARYGSLVLAGRVPLCAVP